MTDQAVELAALRDIYVPPAPDWWPPAPGWWLLLLLLVAVSAWFAWRGWSRFMLRRRLVDLLDELSLSDGSQPDRLRLIRLSRLLRQVALREFPRAQVASLTGVAWLSFLDASGGGGGFVNGPGRVLADGPYQRQPTDRVDWPALVTLVRGWLAGPSGHPDAD